MNSTLYIFINLKQTYSSNNKNIFKILPFQNGDQIADFHFASFRFRQKFGKKNHKEIHLRSNLAHIIGDHEYISIAEILKNC